MNKRLQGFVAGILCCVLFAGIGVYAKSKTEVIEVLYNNIKVYKDNVLCELKDANGTVVEPFIYNGTTYMPVRGTANLADMQVTWDGATQSVYLWDEITSEQHSFLEVCNPYDKDNYTNVFLSSKGQNFSMASKNYSDGITMRWNGSYALFNLDGKYSTLEFMVGHVKGEQVEKNLSFIVDGKTVKNITLDPESLPKKISIPLNRGLQLKIIYTTGINNTSGNQIGLGNIIVN